MGSNQVAGVAGSLQSLGDTLKSDADSINGGGRVATARFIPCRRKSPAPGGGMVTYTFDNEPDGLTRPLSIWAAFVRKVMRGWSELASS